MASVRKILEEICSADSLLEMANATKLETGLPFDVWIGTGLGLKHHEPRLKINIDGKLVPVSIVTGELLVQYKLPGLSKKMIVIREWIIANNEVLIRHYNGEISDREALNGLVVT